MKSTPKLILLHPSPYKHGGTTTSHHRYVLALSSIFILTFLLTLLKTPPPPPPTTPTTLSTTISTALLHYATTNSTMTSRELSMITTTLHTCSPTCNFLIFGLTHETLLWLALNQGGKTVFLDENEYLITKYEQNFTFFEGYDVKYTTQVGKSRELISYARKHRKDQCRPVQNLLYSDCKLAINDLPNYLYDVAWDLILIDGPPGFSSENPGRMSAIFTAGVLGRSKRGPAVAAVTHVFVHDYEREVERRFSEEFLCRENLVEVTDSLAHFVVESTTEKQGRSEFCNNRKKNIAVIS